MSTFEKISPDDPRLTTYALGEMEPAERAEFEQLLQQDETARAIVAEITGTAHHLGVALASEPEPQVSAPLLGQAQAAIVPGKNFRGLDGGLDGGPLTRGNARGGEYAPQSKWWRFPQMYFAISGLAAACFAIGFVLWQPNDQPQRQRQYTEVDLTKFGPVFVEGGSEMKENELAATESSSALVANAEDSRHVREDAFVPVKDEPISTFSIQVNPAAYAKVRRSISGGHLPERQTVRIEEMVNYFPYAYTAPTEKDKVFAAHLEVASAPWAPEHRLVRIGLKGREGPAGGTAMIIAKDVNVRVEFNPREVHSYRLLGYENRMPRQEDLINGRIEAGEIEAGHTVTALYEVVLVGTATPVEEPVLAALKYQQPTGPGLINHPELLTLKVRYQEPVADVNRTLEFALSDTGHSFEMASADFKFAASVVAFGMMLQDSPHKGTATFATVATWAKAGLIDDVAGYRSEFVGLIGQAERLGRN